MFTKLNIGGFWKLLVNQEAKAGTCAADQETIRFYLSGSFNNRNQINNIE